METGGDVWSHSCMEAGGEDGITAVVMAVLEQVVMAAQRL